MGSCFSSKPEHVRYEETATRALSHSADQAIYWYNRSLKVKLKKPEIFTVSIGKTYLLLGTIYAGKKKNYDLAIKHFKKALSYLEHDDKRNFALCYFLLGDCYVKQGSFSAAYDNMEISLDLRIKYFGEDDYETVMSLCGLGFVAKADGNYDLSFKYYARARKILAQLPPNRAQMEMRSVIEEANFKGQEKDYVDLSIKKATALLQPDIAQVCFFLGELALRVDLTVKAFAYFNKMFDYLKKHHGEKLNYYEIFESQANQLRKLAQEFPEDEDNIEKLISYWRDQPGENPVLIIDDD